MAGMESNCPRRQIDKTVLNDKQRQAHDGIVTAITQTETSSTDGGKGIGRLILVNGKAGAGKPYVLDGVVTSLEEDHGILSDKVLVFGTTGRNATNVSGVTVHGWKHGLCLACGNMKFQPLQGKTLQDFQDRMEDVKAIILDEYSMLSQKLLYQMDRRLRQARPHKVTYMWFGGVPIIFFDPGQLPPVLDRTLWDRVSLRKHVDRDGLAAYMQFQTVYILESDMRQDESDPHVAAFADFKNKVRDGMVTRDDIDWLRDRCSIIAMKARDPNEWANRGFDGDDAIHLYPTNKDVRKRNHECLQILGKSIALVEAEHSSPMAKKFSPNQANNLETRAYFAIGAKVLLTSNIQQSIGLCNGAVGTIKDMIWYDGRQPPTVPDAIIVDFGDDYTGDRVFQGEGREKWVPITPMLANFQAKDERALAEDGTASPELGMDNTQGTGSNHHVSDRFGPRCTRERARSRVHCLHASEDHLADRVE